MPDCQTCARPAPDAYLCRGCTEQLTADLRTVPALVDELTLTLTGQTATDDRAGPGSTDTPLPYDLHASVDLETLRDGLWSWCHAVADQRGIRVDAARDPADLARWLARWAGAAAQHTEAGQLHDEITAVIAAARRTIDRRPELRFVGPCDQCGEDLYAGARAAVIECRTDGCAAIYRMEERRLWLLEQAYGRLLTAAEMSRAIRELIPGQALTPNRIAQWAARGLGGQKLTPYLPHPRDPHHRARYLVEEVITFARRAGNLDQHRTAC